MTIEIRDISTIRPYEKNPRLNDKAVNADGLVVVSSTEPQSSDCEHTKKEPGTERPPKHYGSQSPDQTTKN